ncbi:MAG: hypothetical protein WBF53_12165 [Litorimonas sp.]
MHQSGFLETCLGFFDEIALETARVDSVTDCVVPGLSVQDGVLQICEAGLMYPGDILHEAGHIAVVPASERATLCNRSIEDREQSAAEEMMAIAWSYAAATHLELDLETVFHDNGYKGGGRWILDAFNRGGEIGVPMLRWVGMTEEFPEMLQWMRS